MPKGIAKIFVACVTISVAILIGVLTNVAAIKLIQLAVDLSVYGKAFAFDWDSYRPKAQLPQPHIHEQNNFKFYDMEVKDDESLPF